MKRKLKVYGAPTAKDMVFDYDIPPWSEVEKKMQIIADKIERAYNEQMKRHEESAIKSNKGRSVKDGNKTTRTKKILQGKQKGV